MKEESKSKSRKRMILTFKLREREKETIEYALKETRTPTERKNLEMMERTSVVSSKKGTEPYIASHDR